MDKIRGTFKCVVTELHKFFGSNAWKKVLNLFVKSYNSACDAKFSEKMGFSLFSANVLNSEEAG
jgi:hypothetical protein